MSSDSPASPDSIRPSGSLLLRTMAMPGDTNPAGDIFGGWILSQMDIAGSLLAREIAGGRVVTVAVDSMKFMKPVKVGDIVCCYGSCQKIGHTSLTIELELWVKKIRDGERPERFLVTRGHYTYVKVNQEGRPAPLPESAGARAAAGSDAAAAGVGISAGC